MAHPPPAPSSLYLDVTFSGRAASLITLFKSITPFSLTLTLHITSALFSSMSYIIFHHMRYFYLVHLSSVFPDCNVSTTRVGIFVFYSLLLSLGRVHNEHLINLLNELKRFMGRSRKDTKVMD